MTEQMTLEQVLRNIRAKFTSGNSVPVERAVITAEEWVLVDAYLYAHLASPDMSPGRPPQAWVEAAYARFLEINGGDKDRAQTDLGTWVIGINAAMAARESGE